MYRILIVDDEEMVVDGLYEIFTEASPIELDVRKAYNGLEAIKIIKEAKIDILISDIYMPGMDGITLFKEAIKILPHCKVIFLTGYNDFNLIQQIMRHGTGAIDYIVKTEGDDVLWAAVKKAINQLKMENTPDLVISTESDLENTEQTDRLVESINAYIARTPLAEFSVVKMSEDLHYNPSYVSRTYKQVTGRNIMDLISEEKIKEAKRLLGSKVKVRDIARMLGFESDSYFIRFFKKYTGISPKAYRLTHKN